MPNKLLQHPAKRKCSQLGLKRPIGTRFICKEPWINPADGKSQFIYTVIGVVENYHFQSLRKKIAPLIFTNSNETGWGSGDQDKGRSFENGRGGDRRYLEMLRSKTRNKIQFPGPNRG